MNMENEIISYLSEFGNTKENDMINYGVIKFSCASETMKRIIRQLIVKGRIHYVVHNKLDPPEAYLSLHEPLPPEATKILLEALIRTKTTEEESKKILEEAAALAKDRIKERECH